MALEAEGKKRNLNLDLIRCVAAACVVAVHSLSATGFYSQEFTGRTMYLMCIVCVALDVCVPLFAILSGYLCSRMALTGTYYKRIIPILITYLLAGIFSLCYRRFCSGAQFGFEQAVLMLLDVSGGASGYSWYINMYLGLFLMIPFLNILYHALETREKKKWLLATCLILTSVPSALDNFDWITPGAFFIPGAAGETQLIFPDYWQDLWPVTYYFAGAYFREYGSRLSIRKNGVLLALSLVASGSYNYFRSYGGVEYFQPGYWGNYENVINALLLFSLLLKLDLSGCPAVLGKVMTRLSKLALGIYLCSYISDNILYSLLLREVPRGALRFRLAPIMFLASFALAAVLAQVIAWLQTGIGKLMGKIKTGF